MLIIYGGLPVGGIETFFLRMAKERKMLGLTTKILLLSNKEESNSELLEQITKYAKVYFPQDIFPYIPKICRFFPLVSPVNHRLLLELLEGVDQIHVELSMHALLGYRFSKISGRNLPITIGFYHYVTHIWGGDKIPLFEKINRRFVFEYLSDESLFMFSDGNRELYRKYKKKDFNNSKVFRLGVVDKKDIEVKGFFDGSLRIVSVGRLVDFKTYNFYMLDIVSSLVNKGISCVYDIYGDGPLKNEIQNKIDFLNLNDYVVLRGTLPYSNFDCIVPKYDLFVGSGTAIIQAASLGIPSIVGVENFIHPKTYGYFCDVFRYEYNLKGLDLPLISVEKIILDFMTMNEYERKSLKERHLFAVNGFTNQSCQKSMDLGKNVRMPSYDFKYNRLTYEISRVVDKLHMLLSKSHPRNSKFEYFLNLDEKSD